MTRAIAASVTRAVTGEADEVALRGGGEVEADERDDRAGDDRRHDDRRASGRRPTWTTSPTRTEGHPGHDDAAEGAGHPVPLLHRGGDRGDEGERRAEVARHPARREEEEEHRADAGEEERRRRREAGQERDEERRAEHRDDVLGADPDRARPAEPLLGCDHLTGRRSTAVTVDLPSQSQRVAGHQRPLRAPPDRASGRSSPEVCRTTAAHPGAAHRGVPRGADVTDGEDRTRAPAPSSAVRGEAGRCGRVERGEGRAPWARPSPREPDRMGQRFFWISAHWRSTSSRPPHMKNACSPMWSYSPSQIFVNASMVSASGTVEPSMPVNCLAT